jgi:excisionase family DNA binding protein
MGDRIRTLSRSSSICERPTTAQAELALIDQILGRFADLVVDRLIERTAASTNDASEWLDARDAAAYLGVHRDTVRKLAAQRAIPVHQDGPGCKLHFRRDELDEWRRSGGPGRLSAVRLRAVS